MKGLDEPLSGSNSSLGFMIFGTVVGRYSRKEQTAVFEIDAHQRNTMNEAVPLSQVKKIAFIMQVLKLVSR